jgi:hypothetical protein
MCGTAEISKEEIKKVAIFTKSVIIFGLSIPRFERRQPPRLLQSGFRASPYDIIAQCTLTIGLRRCSAAQEHLRSQLMLAIFTKSAIVFDLSRPRCDRRQPPRLLQSGFRASPYDIITPCTLTIVFAQMFGSAGKPKINTKCCDFYEIGYHFRSFET